MIWPKESEDMIEILVNEARRYFTPYERRALVNLENLKTSYDHEQNSIFTTLSDKPTHNHLEIAFSQMIFQRAFLSLLPRLRKNCSCVNQLICKGC